MALRVRRGSQGAAWLFGCGVALRVRVRRDSRVRRGSHGAAWLSERGVALGCCVALGVRRG